MVADAIIFIISKAGCHVRVYIDEKKTTPDEVFSYLGIASDKLRSIQVYEKKYLSKRFFQSLLGTLLYMHNSMVPERSFIN